MEPLRVILHEERDKEYTKYIKDVTAHPSKGNVPEFVQPQILDFRFGNHRQDQAHPDKALLESRTSPNDRCAGSALKTDGMFADHIDRVTEETDEPIDDLRYMAGHELKRRRDVQLEPRYHLAVFITGKSELPEVVRHQ